MSFKYPEGRGQSPNLAMRQGNWKLLVNDTGAGTELYDLATDPSEKTSLAEQQPKPVGQIQQQLLASRKALPGLPK